MLTCPPYTSPGWLDESGNPTSCVSDCPVALTHGECVLPTETDKPNETSHHLETAKPVPVPMVQYPSPTHVANPPVVTGKSTQRPSISTDSKPERRVVVSWRVF